MVFLMKKMKEMKENEENYSPQQSAASARLCVTAGGVRNERNPWIEARLSRPKISLHKKEIKW